MNGWVGTEVETGFRGLVVAHVLGSGRETVGDIFHQTVDAVVGGDGADEDAELAAVKGTGDNFFAPVAEDVGTEAGVRFRAVVEADVFEPDDVGDGLLLPVVFRDGLVVE